MASIEGLYLTNIDIVSNTRENLEFTADLYEKGLHLGSVRYTTESGVMLTDQKLISSVFTLLISNLYNKMVAESKNSNLYIQSMFEENQMPTLMLEEIVKHLFILTMVEDLGLATYGEQQPKQPNYTGAFLMCHKHLVNGAFHIENYFFSSTSKLNINNEFYADIQNEYVKQEILASAETFTLGEVIINSKEDVLINGCIIIETDRPMPDLTVTDYFSFLDYIELT